VELTLINIAKDLRKSLRTVQRLAKNGSLPVITKSTKSGFIYVVPLQAYIEWKNQKLAKSKECNFLSDLDFLKQQIDGWLSWCKSGALTGKPLSEKTIELYKYCLNYYFLHIPRRYTKTPLISLEQSRLVLSDIDPKSFSLKLNIYSALKSFVKYLIAKNIANATLLAELKQLSPRRVYPPKRTHCTLEQFNLLLLEATKWHTGQSQYDVALNSALVSIIGFAGVRVSEVCNLRLQDIDLVNKRLFVYLGKGKKNRYVGICNQLHCILNEYLKLRPKSEVENFFVTFSPVYSRTVAFTRFTLLQKIKRLSKRTDIKITPHGLRRTFATIAANSGKPINIISLALGHADLKTTQGYLMTSQEEVVKEMQGW